MAKRIAAPIEVALTLTIASGFVGWLFLRGVSGNAQLLAVSVPAVSALAVMILCLSVEGLLPGERISFPANLLLPVVHLALTAMLVQLLTTNPSPIEAVPERVLPVLIWQNWKVLGATAFGEMALLSAFLFQGPPR
jgi:hypothetical protein